MRVDRTTAADAERLNEFWDQFVDGKASASDFGNHLGSPEHHLETLVFYLESLKPHMSPSSLGSLDRSVSHHVGEVLPVPATTNATTSANRSRPATPAPAGAMNTRSRLGLVVRAFDGLAAALLILIVVSSLVLVGPARNFLDSEVPGRFAAMLGIYDDESTGEGLGSHSMITVEVQPGDYEGGRVEVGLWQVTLPPGSTMAAAPTGDEPPVTFGFSVSTGAVVFMSNGEERPVGPDGSVGGHPELAYVRNATADPAILLVLAPTPATATFPLTIGPWVAAGSPAASPTVTPQSMDTEPVLISFVDLTGQKAFQYRVLVTETVLAPGMGLGDVRLFGPPTSRLRAVVVREGQLAIVPGGPLATPAMAQELVPGDAVQLEADGLWSSDLRVTGPENATVLGLLIMPAAVNHTLDQTLESIAPFWGEWTVPESGEVNLAVRRLILQPGGTYRLPTDAGVLYHVASGTVDMLNSDSGNTVNVVAGGTVAQLPGTVLALSNPGSRTVEVIQTLVFNGSLKGIASGESATNGQIALLVEQSGTLPAGDASLMLEVHQYNGENDGGASGEGGQSLVLITSTDGEIEVSRLGGDAKVVPSVGSDPVEPPLGEGVELQPGGFLLAQPGGGWSITGASGAPSTGLVLTISPNMEPEGMPSATPAPGAIGTVTLVGNADACDVAPLTSDLVDDIVATPSAAPLLLDRSLRGEAGGVADPTTLEAIVAMLQAYTDCNATGDYTRIYAFYSDQAIRESESVQSLVEAEHDVGEGWHVTTTVEEIVRFPDGRASARAGIDGEAAYLTFVYEDGAWKIDVWDDSVGGRVPIATPAA